MILFLFALIVCTTAADVYINEYGCKNVGEAVSSIEHGLSILKGRWTGGNPTVDSHQMTGFHAKVTSDTALGTAQTVIFDSVITNIGNAYNPQTGHFTAPHDGVYFFASSFLKTTGTPALHLQMVKNTDEISKGHASTASGPESGSMNAVVELKKNDVVKIRHHPSQGSETIHGEWSYFTGYLIK